MSKELKRDPIKYIRDRAKSAYEKGNSCHICGETENLDFHHYYTLSPLLRAWLQKKKYKAEDVLEYRDEFIAENHAEMYDHTVTLCHTHHLQLHSIYGKDPSLGTAKKQMRWVQIQREKHGLV
jgi:hypothetical protein